MAAYTSMRMMVSTHSRPKAAAIHPKSCSGTPYVSTHSRPKAAVDESVLFEFVSDVSTHSRPKAAAKYNQSNRNNP